MIKILETRHAFLDTQVFIAANFQYLSGNLLKIAQLSKEGRVVLHLTEITVQEIETNIIKAVKEAKSAINAFRKKGKILWNSQNPFFGCIFSRFDIDAVQADLIGQFHQFLETTGTDIIDISYVDIHSIFSKYFGNIPPFGSGKKKSEFPDAFALAALEHWCEENQLSLYIVSNDNDLKSACKSIASLLHINKIEELIEIIIFEDENVPEIVFELLENVQNEIDQKIIELFSNLGFWLDDQDGDVENVKVKSINYLETYLANIDGDTATFNFSYSLTFSADITYKDFSYAFYDKEVDRYYMVEWIKKTITREKTFPAKVEITFNKVKPYSVELFDIKLGIEDVNISADDNSVYPYK